MDLGLKEKVMKDIVIATIASKLVDDPQVARVFKTCCCLLCQFTFSIFKVSQFVGFRKAPENLLPLSNLILLK